MKMGNCYDFNRETRKADSQECKNKVNSKRPDYARSGRPKRSSEKEHKADALALGAEEGRDKLRKAAVRSKYPMTHRCPNAGTHML